MVRLDEMLVLSTGEVLSEFSDDRLKELRGDANKLAKTLGRTAHYERKNRSNLKCLDDDLDLIEREVYRRRGLVTLTLCGLTWHWQNTHEVKIGRYSSKEEMPAQLHKWAKFFEGIEPHVEQKGSMSIHHLGRKPYWTAVMAMYEWERTAPCSYTSGYVQERMNLTEYEFEKVKKSGGKAKRLPDPLASPWTVADVEDVPWIVGGEDGAAPQGEE